MYPRPNVGETLPFEGDVINKLFAEHYKASLRTAKGILLSREDSEDAVQTACCAESVISGIAFPKVADQLGLAAAAAKLRLFRARRKVEHALHPVIHRWAA